MDLNGYLLKEVAKKGGEFPIVPAIECADGFHISVQAHYGAYSTPRTNFGPWSNVECGFPSAPVPELTEWQDGSGDQTQSVYGYVPIDVVEKLIESHGGQKAGVV